MCEFHQTRQYKPKNSPWGPDDQIGRLNMITGESIEKVMNSIDPTKVYNLSVDYFMGMPSWLAAGDPPYQIWMTHTPSGTLVDNPMGLDNKVNELVSYSGDAISMYTHCGTHMDTFNHFGYKGEIWNGFKEKEHLGSRHWAVCGPENFPPIISRGVMIDVAASKGVDMLPESYGIGKADIQEALDQQGTDIKPGDIVMIRTGRMTVWPDRDKYLNSTPGINIEAAEFIVSKGAIIIGADNISVEQLPSPEPDNWHPVHSFCFTEVGVPLIEVMWLEELSKAKLYEVGIIGTNMPLVGATGSPIQPLAFPLKKDSLI
ncbi:cyclase family protein [Bacillus sp. JJ1521]|uniref:cyclase family protein n=1 Tax=Bacillus sp. JJ1521 TaxID=3122957 RepID=UPI002FFE0F84